MKFSMENAGVGISYIEFIQIGRIGKPIIAHISNMGLHGSQYFFDRYLKYVYNGMGPSPHQMEKLC